MMADMREHLQKVHILPEQQQKARKEVLVCLSTNCLYVAAP